MRARVRSWFAKRGPGAALAGGLGAAGWALHLALPGVSAILVALLLGMAAGHVLPRARHQAGASWVVKHGLDVAVVLLGFGITLATARAVGLPGLALVALLVPATVGLFVLLGRLVRLRGHAPLLLGVGTAVCGASAVAAAAVAVRAKERDTAMALSAVGVLSSVGLVAFPLLGAAMGLDSTVYGAWAGASIHAVANAVGAGFALSPGAGEVATLVKLARVATLPLVVLALSLATQRARGESRLRLPPMVWGFLIAALASNLFAWPDAVRDVVARLADVLFLVAMAALGLTTDLRGGGAERARDVALLAVGGWALMALGALALALALYPA